MQYCSLQHQTLLPSSVTSTSGHCCLFGSILHSSGVISPLFSSRDTGNQTSQVALVVKNLAADTEDIRDVGLTPDLGRSPGGGHGNPLQYSCLENPHEQRSLVGYSP